MLRLEYLSLYCFEASQDEKENVGHETIKDHLFDVKWKYRISDMSQAVDEIRQWSATSQAEVCVTAITN